MINAARGVPEGQLAASADDGTPRCASTPTLVHTPTHAQPLQQPQIRRRNTGRLSIASVDDVPKRGANASGATGCRVSSGSTETGSNGSRRMSLTSTESEPWNGKPPAGFGSSTSRGLLPNAPPQLLRAACASPNHFRGNPDGTTTPLPPRIDSGTDRAAFVRSDSTSRKIARTALGRQISQKRVVQDPPEGADALSSSVRSLKSSDSRGSVVATSRSKPLEVMRSPRLFNRAKTPTRKPATREGTPIDATGARTVTSETEVRKSATMTPRDAAQAVRSSPTSQGRAILAARRETARSIVTRSSTFEASGPREERLAPSSSGAESTAATGSSVKIRSRALSRGVAPASRTRLVACAGQPAGVVEREDINSALHCRGETMPPPQCRRGVVSVEGAAPALVEVRSPVRSPTTPRTQTREDIIAHSAAGLQDCSANRTSEPSETMLQDALGPWASWLDAKHSDIGRGPKAPALFEVFRTAEDLRATFASFAQLFRLAMLAPTTARGAEAAAAFTCPAPWASVARPWRYPYEPIRVLLSGHWKAKQLWAKLDARCAKPEYVAAPCSRGRLEGRRAVVVGGGPSGLRAAIELSLLGLKVIVLERREGFTRLNRLHLWSWCGEELKALGARCLEPPPLDFGSDPDLLHIGISELQTLLLKTALLFGVQVVTGAFYSGVDWETDGWTVRVRNTPGSDALELRDGKRMEISNVGVVIGAGGLTCTVGRPLGMSSIEVSNRKSAEAIGLVCNFLPSGSVVAGGDRSMRSFALARQFYEKLFEQLATETGVELENIVYTKSKASHYFVMTPTRKALADGGVFRDPSSRPGLESTNIDRDALDRLVRKIVAFRFKEGEQTLPEAVAKSDGDLTYADAGPQLFDFSKMQRASEGLTFIEPPDAADADDESNYLLAGLAGDSLIEPFWPEGLGIVRGFLGALDVSYAVARWSGGADRDEVCSEFTAAYGQLKSLAAVSRGRVLRDDLSGYGVAPCTRYRCMSSKESAFA